MELVVNQRVLSQALNKIRTIVERKNVNEVLNNIFLEIIDKELSIKATDKEIIVPQSIKVLELLQPGSTLVPAHLLSDIIKKAPENCDIHLKAEENVIHVKFKKAHFVLNTLPSSNFPKVDMQQQFAVEISIRTEYFLNIINKIKCAISLDEIRYYLNGIFLHFNQKANLVAVATDAHKLAQHIIHDAQISLHTENGDNPLDKGIIIPRKTINELPKFVDNLIPELQIKINRNNIQFEQNNKAILYSSLIDGIFPEYQNILNIDYNKCQNLTIPYTQDLVDAINRVSILLGDMTRRIMMKLTHHSLEINVVDIQAGSASEILDVTYEGSPINIVFNANYAASILDNFSGMAEIYITSEIAPVIINNPAQKDLIYILMPMHNT